MRALKRIGLSGCWIRDFGGVAPLSLRHSRAPTSTLSIEASPFRKPGAGCRVSRRHHRSQGRRRYRESVTIHTDGLTLRSRPPSASHSGRVSRLWTVSHTRSHGRDLSRVLPLTSKKRGTGSYTRRVRKRHHHRFQNRRLRRGRRVRVRHRESEGVGRRGDRQHRLRRRAPPTGLARCSPAVLSAAATTQASTSVTR